MAFEPITKGLLKQIDAEIKKCLDKGEERPTLAAAIRCRGRHLIVTSNKGSGGGYFNPGLPKGGAQRGETALEALRREIREELRIRKFKIKAYCGSYSVASVSEKDGCKVKRYFVFYVAYSGPQKLRINGELSGYYWMTISEVERTLETLLPERRQKYHALMSIFSCLKVVEKKKTPARKKKKVSRSELNHLPGHTS